LFFLQIAHLIHQQRGDVRRPPDHRPVDDLAAEPPPKLERRSHGASLGRADARASGEFLDRRVQQGAQTARSGEKPGGQLQCALAATATADDDRQKLRAGEILGAETLESLTGPLVRRQVMDSTALPI
jgi:hypothetical protein